MENDQKIEKNSHDLLTRYSAEISEACERAVREALQKHKAAGNPIAVYRDGEVVLLQPDEIPVS